MRLPRPKAIDGRITEFKGDSQAIFIRLSFSVRRSDTLYGTSDREVGCHVGHGGISICVRVYCQPTWADGRTYVQLGIAQWARYLCSLLRT